ncbi:SIR2 family protein [Latilactobacillus sakei]|uniref:SIR2 family protein n=1 Tax=Latilactobacillus sakei TaxID=1599 RepID=UPI000DC64591|nr:SIR2 family protein [Latilactobacillus sakei]SPS03687.1 hypothetical protein LAS9624_00507 [Latilactobacillus sakei]
MTDYYTEKEFKNLVSTISDAAKDFKLVVFIGAGISLSQGYPNWDGYIEKLIHFWQFNIRKFPETKGKMSNKLLSQFDAILQSENTNKRKIDLLYTLLKSVLGERFSDVKLEFEEYFFNDVSPNYSENNILAELIKLDPIFITSNYDFEIERHLVRSKQSGDYRPLNNIHEFIISNKGLRSGDVLHLHGTTAGDWSYFVNSSVDYSRQYLKSPQEFNNLNKWFENKEPVVVLLGSSMEEEEILSLLPATTKNFALMKANSNENREFREIYNQTYQINHSTTIFWYGDSYEDLPIKVNEIVKAVQNELEIPKNIEDWNILHTLSTNNNKFKEILERYANDEWFLFDVFRAEDEELIKKILVNTLNSKILVEKVGNISSFWTMTNNNFDILEKKQVSALLQIFKNQELSINRNEIFKVFERIINSAEVTQTSRGEIIRALAQYKSIINTPFFSDPDLMGYWLLEQLQEGYLYSRHIYYRDRSVKFRLNTEMMMDLIDVTNEKYNNLYSSFKEIISDDLVQIMYDAFLNNMIYINDEPILSYNLDPLLEVRLFQKILVNIDNKKNLSDSNITKLITHIDFSDEIFGNELNLFVKKHKLEIDKAGITALENYQDGVWTIEGGSVDERSFINNDEIINKDVNSIVKILLHEDNESKTSFQEDFLIEKTFRATADFLISLFTKKDEASNKMMQVMTEKGALLYPKYQLVYIKIITEDEYEPELKEKYFKVFLNNFSLDNFSWEEGKLFKYLIDKEKLSSPAFDDLLQVNVNNLNSDHIYLDRASSELLEPNNFINSELGRYLDILIQLSKVDNSRSDRINIIVEKVNSNEFKEFTQGSLYALNRSKNLEKITVNTFQGYSYSVRGFRKVDLKNFKPIVQILLEKGYVNEFNKDNLFILSIHEVNPQEDEINWNKINFSQLIDTVLQNKVQFKYETQWIEEIMKHDVDGRYGKHLLYSLSEKSVEVNKAEKVCKLFKEYINDYDAKVNIGLLPNSMKKAGNDVQSALLIKLFFLLLDNSKIEKEYFGSDTLLNLMKYLDLESQKRLVKHHNLSTILSPLEIEDLKREINW